MGLTKVAWSRHKLSVQAPGLGGTFCAAPHPVASVLTKCSGRSRGKSTLMNEHFTSPQQSVQHEPDPSERQWILRAYGTFIKCPGSRRHPSATKFLKYKFDF